MKISIQTISFEVREMEVEAAKVNRTAKRYIKQGWQLMVKGAEREDGMVRLQFRRQTTPSIEVKP